jgi:hypothetical protein
VETGEDAAAVGDLLSLEATIVDGAGKRHRFHDSNTKLSNIAIK